MTPRKGDILELKIDRVAQGGHGVARVDGFVLFVKGAVPGDTARALVTRKKKDFAEARLLEAINPSPDRVNAPCPYFGHCGGCQWQHVLYSRQLEYKKNLVEEAMVRIGGFSGIRVRDPVESEKIFGYRNKMEFSFSDRPWVMDYHPRLAPPIRERETGDGLPVPKNSCQLVGGTGEGEFSGGAATETAALSSLDRKDKENIAKPPRQSPLALGLHVPGTFSKVLDVEACLLQEDRGNEILRTVKEFAKESGVPPYNLKTHEGFWRFLTLRHSSYFREWMVNVITSEYRKELAENLSRQIASKFPDVKTVVNNVTARRAGVAVGEWESVLTGTGVIEDRIGPYAFQVSSNSFFQTNTTGAAKLYDIVTDYAELTGSESVLDLYSGTGTIPIFIAAKSRQVVGMEITQSAVEDAGKNCRANGVDNCRFILGDIRDGLSFVPFKPDVLVIDPPRTGMHKDVAAGILELGTKRIVYVSCNPATMARDLRQMMEAYEVVEIQPVDMFPQTYHVESVAKLVRKTAQGPRGAEIRNPEENSY
jgi:23S rRNA (uracil1939-C5)-methyltransferase